MEAAPEEQRHRRRSAADAAAAVWRRAVRPLVRSWDSDDPLDAFGLVHFASSAGDALVAIALADSVFLSLPVGQAKVKVALYLALTMAPLAVAAPLMVPLLDRGGFRRAISFSAAAGRAVAAVYAAPRFSTLLLFPSAFVLLVLSKVHGITRNGLVTAYASEEPGRGLVQTNARLGRLAAVAAALSAIPGVIALKLAGAPAALYLAAVAYAVAALLNLRLPQPPPDVRTGDDVTKTGRVPHLATAAAGTAGLRGASGFLLFLLAFALRTSHQPRWWFGVLAGAATIGGFVGDVLAPRLPRSLREEVVVLGALVGAGVAAFLAYAEFTLPVLALFGLLAGMALEFGKLSFQSLMQRSAPGGAQGRVFVRYEVVFQLAWVVGAFLPAVLPVSFRVGVLLLAIFYLALGLTYIVRPLLPDRSVLPPAG